MSSFQTDHIRNLLRYPEAFPWITHAAVTTSTMDDVRRQFSLTPAAGLVAVADTQQSGRGRRGRAWHSPPGAGLYCSLTLALPADMPPVAAGHLCTLAIWDMAQLHGVQHLCIKWPNDVRARGRKFAGVLVESLHSTGKERWFAAGIGINLSLSSSDLPDSLKDTATSFSIETGIAPDRAQVLAGLLDRIEERRRSLGQEGFHPLQEAWKERCDTLGKTVRIETDAGLLTGLAVDLNDEGVLILRTESGDLIPCTSGNVTYCV